MRFLIFLLAFVFLALLGGLLSVGHYKEAIESSLVTHAQKALAKKGFGDVDLASNHMFLTIPGSGFDSAAQTAMGQLIDSEVKGAYTVVEENPGGDKLAIETPMAWAVPIQESDVNIFMGNNDSVILSGLVPTEFIKQRYGDTVSSAMKNSQVDNQLVVGSKVVESKWLNGLPNFLANYLNVPGVSGFKADRDGFTLDGKVASAEVKVQLSEDAEMQLGKFGQIQNRLSVLKLSPPSLKIYPVGEDEYEVSGKLPQGGLKDSLLYTVLKALPGKHVKDSVDIDADVSEPWWAANAKKLIPEFFDKTGKSGFLEFSDDNLHLGADIKDDSVFDTLSKIGSEGKSDDFNITKGGAPPE